MGANVEADPPASKSDQGRVLFVTEASSLLAPIATRLEKAGFTVAIAAGAASIISLRRFRPHIAILDVTLKSPTAQELTRMMVSTRMDGGAIPIMLVGNEAVTIKRQGEAIASGAFDYFQLPQSLSLILARAAQLIALKRDMNRLHEEAKRDMLTGLTNRRHFRLGMGQEVERWRRYKVPCSLLVLDIDYLKRVNDALGHSAGDKAIRHVAESIAEVAGPSDVASRLGGEEFALLLAGADQAKAVTVAERLRLVISAEPVDGVGLITVSIGAASCPVHADSEKKLYEAGDAALYRAKNEGRNRTVVATQMKSATE